ncbi:putative quinol monooxygenase [Roseicitreum antarcticum]|uniref:Quinol monooxygenase YgiN n=1 Tax=Roseicitreum antarcticum TaxID=564137 RepID=A0A1H3BFN2_9RHOB|nr:antibiotic biosynthesis monooxygenase [Roseicitreum antarcticum]SDX40595.1 Quinol monooxygenase YgiN [Roseicitreum antarcticum]
MITLTGKLICATEAEAELVRAHLPEHIRLTNAEPGCIAFTAVPGEDPLVWQVDEAFEDRAAFEAHQTRTKASDWARETAGIQRDFKLSEG